MENYATKHKKKKKVAKNQKKKMNNKEGGKNWIGKDCGKQDCRIKRKEQKKRKMSLTFHFSAHFFENSENTIASVGCFFLFSSRQVWKK